LLLKVLVKGGQASSADDLLATLVSANSESAGADWVVDFATAAPRSIDGRDYPSLTQRQHDDATGETLDIIGVWVCPSGNR
jgi:hypothetical protein